MTAATTLPGTCPDCVVALDPANIEAGQQAHMTCPPPPPMGDAERKMQARVLEAAVKPPAPVPADTCDVSWDCSKTEPPLTYQDGTYCGNHARMMTPRAQWQARGVPEPPKPPAKAAAAASADEAPALSLEAEAEPG